MNKKTLVVFACLFLLAIKGKTQDRQWPALPGLDYSDRSIALINQESFMALSGAAITSYVLSEFILEDVEDLNFYQTRIGIIGTTGGTVTLENFGIEKRLSHWFGIGLELNNQQWFYEANNGIGVGFNTYYRWYVLGKKSCHPI